MPRAQRGAFQVPNIRDHRACPVPGADDAPGTETTGLPRRLATFALAAALTLLTGCAAFAPVKEPIGFVPRTVAEPDASPAPAASQPVPAAEGAIIGDAAASATASPSPIIERGTGEFFNPTVARRGPGGGEGGDVTFNFENTPIQAVVKSVLGDLLQESYVIAPGVQGNVTFSTAKPISLDQARAVLETLLAWNNLAMIYRDGRYTILPSAQAIPGNLVPRSGAASAQRGFDVRVVPLRYISPTEMQKVLAPYVRQGAIVQADNARNLIVLAGSSVEMRNYLETIELFDVDWLKGMSIGMFPLERVEVKTVLPDLEKIFGEGGQTPLAGMFRFLPIERTNSILVITPRPEYLERAGEWIGRLDRGGNDAGSQLYVYYVKNVKAKDLAGNLSDIFGGGGGGGAARSEASIGSVVPGVESVEIRSLNAGGGPDRQPPATPAATQAPAAGGSGISIVGGDDVRITAIEESNALLIRASPSQYDSILAAIRRLDIEPLQVHIEAQVVQVNLTGNLEFGVRWFFQNATSGEAAFAYRRDNRGFGTENARRNNVWSSFAGTAGQDGLNWTFLTTSAEALVKALESQSRVQVLSAPSVLVLNNKQASVNVGTQIPVVSSFINPGSGIVNPGQPGQPGQPVTGFGQSFVQFRDTGLILNVTPRVNPGGLVYLEIKQEESNIAGAPDPTGNVPIARRVIETEVAVQSGETLVLGGLIKEDRNTGQDGVPGLMRIPIIGRAFSRSTTGTVRQELLVLLRPTVVSSTDEARSLTDEYRVRFENVRPLIEREMPRLRGDAAPVAPDRAPVPVIDNNEKPE
jgi:general secretion pathway protein D